MISFSEPFVIESISCSPSYVIKFSLFEETINYICKSNKLEINGNLDGTSRLYHQLSLHFWQIIHYKKILIKYHIRNNLLINILFHLIYKKDIIILHFLILYVKLMVIQLYLIYLITLIK